MRRSETVKEIVKFTGVVLLSNINHSIITARRGATRPAARLDCDQGLGGPRAIHMVIMEERWAVSSGYH